jgi:hypothetical protein
MHYPSTSLSLSCFDPDEVERMNRFVERLTGPARTSCVVALAVYGLMCGFAQPASAYIDMGTTSYVFNVIVGAIFSGLFFVKIYWSKLTQFTRRVVLRRAPEPQESNSAEKDTEAQL